MKPYIIRNTLKNQSKHAAWQVISMLQPYIRTPAMKKLGPRPITEQQSKNIKPYDSVICAIRGVRLS